MPPGDKSVVSEANLVRKQETWLDKRILVHRPHGAKATVLWKTSPAKAGFSRRAYR